MADPSKTEKATPKKRQEARKKGQVAKSPELNSGVIILAVFLGLKAFGPSMLSNIKYLFEKSFTSLNTTILTPENVPNIFFSLLILFAKMLLPIFAIVVVASFIVGFGQVGFLLSFEALAPKLSKVNPIKGLKNLFSPRSFVELIKSFIKLIILGYIGYSVAIKNIPNIINLMDMDINQILGVLAGIAYEIGIKVGIAILILAIFDYIYQRYEHEKGLRMSKYEVKEEMKSAEGDPKIKGKIRRKQMEMAMRRMMLEVPKADVVITNPIHLAIALKYDPKTMSAPKVVAKGARLIAEKIKEIANEHKIPIIEDKMLAQSLYRSAEEGQEIPLNLYQAVAEILAYVYQINQRRRAI
ncbi:MAG TPA: flagellar biosynthesis protein FlhB [Actinobacteria bacterium]|nr:flagellar biosynthesis protein FlhB [Actinomycetota bacterium]